MPSLNKVFWMGNVGHDVELKTTPAGNEVCEFNVACTEVYYNKAGEKVEETEWKTIVTWGKLAAACASHLYKGRPCLSEGKLKTDKWDDKETGKKMEKTKIVAQKVTFLGKHGDNDGGSGQRGDYGRGRGDDDIGF